MFRSLIRHPRTQSLLAGLIGSYLAFCYRTTRWTLLGEENLPDSRQGAPYIVAFWHERLPMMPMLWTMVHARYPGTAKWQPHVLVSRHRDGRFIGDIVSRFRLVMIHGSTSRGGASALRALLRVLRSGSPVAITPDGPRGPRRQAAEGVAQLAALARVPVLPTAAATRCHRLLPSWDRMMLPLPFTRGVLVCGPAIAVAEADSAAVARIGQALTEACDRADAWTAGRSGA
ncbi:lysophospholipid acyltransferase family protein [Roseomonas marmotae]|uniref:Lysophospholipid acyltransferase family protein n=1 Tax=Roseomonas marmotae TaxID=2768161 RepID=A0ABS3K8F2_9PROT|nr:lysophospholipid acyltransferase family protein [Roseomonas marmotae]MBO1073205.1 lysophospholipid acyltransferase family protein [Roseomonas marmotae]QTI79165.1 lysophospholipid acyltransferase family protein [Roseomonas marmotae]